MNLLCELVEYGLVHRTVQLVGPSRGEYALTAHEQPVAPLIKLRRTWGRHAQACTLSVTPLAS